jgi:putative two-component system response regulator
MARILVVDDAPENIAILVELLRSDHTVQVATYGEKALMIAADDTPPDLVLLDIAMPGMDGFEVCRLLKQDEDTRKIPVIFVTAMDEQADEEKGFELGAVDYVTKPFKPALVRARVQLHLRLALHQRLLEELVERSGRDLVLSPTELGMLRDLQRL